jgi:hypothetical protein
MCLARSAVRTAEAAAQRFTAEAMIAIEAARFFAD